LDQVLGVQAALIAQWMSVGFIHGVMNTDNMSISGETIDYGPCAFLEAYHPQTVFSSIDQRGRYAYSNQPHAAHWNLTRLAETLLPLLEQEEGSKEAALDSAQEALAGFGTQFEAARDAGFGRKLGMMTQRAGDWGLVEELLDRMAANKVDFTLMFRRLCGAAAGEEGDAGVRELFAEPGAWDSWAMGWRKRLEEEAGSAEERVAAMRRVNPAFVPRNHLVEAVIEGAVERRDFEPFEEMLEVVTRPCDEQPRMERYGAPARPEELVSRTFCGT
jgi:uncharacterized protein YdiU (UPF0061 family)